MQRIIIADSSQVGEARRAATSAASAAGLSEEDAGRAALAATEMATNILKHAGSGEILVGRREGAVELTGLDRGPGMSDLQQCLADGYSTSATQGAGLGAIRRAASAFEIDTRPGVGTAVFCLIGRPAPAAGALWAAVRLPKPGEEACGDDWAARKEDGRLDLMVADGLGHGPLAATASQEAVRLFLDRPGAPPTEAVSVLHRGLGHTRGAALAVASVDPVRANVVFAGIGNIAGVTVSGGRTRKMVSMAGVAGQNARKIVSFDYPYDPGAELVVILHSDGLGTSWTLDAYPGLERAHPALIAGVLYRDYNRGRDDVTVLAARVAPA